MGIFSNIKLLMRLGILVAFGIVLAWGIRVNGLRDDYRSTLQDISTAVDDSKELKDPIKNEAIAGFIRARTIKVKVLSDNWDTLFAAHQEQKKAVDALKAEAELLREKSEVASKEAEEFRLANQGWIDRADVLSKRLEASSDEEELKQCKGAMDGIYQTGF